MSTFPNNPTATLLMLGDSLVAGGNWQERFSQWRVHNCGVPGLTTFDLRQSLPQLQRYYPYADLIQIMIGTNDLLIGDLDFPTDLAVILTSLTNCYPNSSIVVASLLPFETPYLTDQLIRNTNTTLHAVVTTAGATLLNLYDCFKEAPGGLFDDDGIHLTTTAYDLWTAALVAHIAFPDKND